MSKARNLANLLADGAVGASELASTLDLSSKTLTLPAGTALPSQSGQNGNFLTTDGTSASWGAVGGGGSSIVLQVVNSTVAPYAITTTSTGFVTTGVSISITPSATSSKIIILLTGGGHYVPAAVNFCYVTVFRGATNIGNSVRGLSTYYSTGGTAWEIRSHALSVVDSPSTTSSTTYTFYFRKDGGAEAYQFNNGDRSELTIIAMEIAA